METYFVFTDETGVYQKHPNNKTIQSSPFYIRSNVIMSAEAYKRFQLDMKELNAKYKIPIGEEIKWSDLGALVKGNPRKGFLTTMTLDKLKAYYKRVFSRASSAIFIFTITNLQEHKCTRNESEIVGFHLQEALQRIQMEVQNSNGFAVLIMDELNKTKLKTIKRACHELTEKGDFIDKYKHVYHGVLTECSAQSFGIQLADFAAGVMNGYLRRGYYDKSNYSFANDLCVSYILPRLRHNSNGKIMGFGIREVPSDSNVRKKLSELFQNIEFTA